ncbi:MAG: energy-coupled thiamine transporter ThiT [Solobacterium sp.]|nr:energy-coupled thiamine transporter ThiT [Solobacterium sp.]
MIPAFFLKYFATVISGAYYWAEGTAAGSVEAWSFSLTYNLGYNLVTMIVCSIVVPMLAARVLPKTNS